MNKIILIQTSLYLLFLLSFLRPCKASNVIQNSCFSRLGFKIGMDPAIKHQTPVHRTYFVISGSFIIRQNALHKQQSLLRNGFQHTSVRIFPESEFYSVVVDSFASEAEAKNLKLQLDKRKFDCFIKHLSL